MNSPALSSTGSRPRGWIAFGVFLLFATGMAAFAGATLLWHGTVFDRLWKLNPRAYRELSPFGKPAGILFLALGVTLAVACLGWFKRRMWGWRLAVLIIAAQVLGDLVNVFTGRIIEGGVGVAIAGSLLCYLARSKVRDLFGSQTSTSQPMR